jgi:hypothetical protein
VVLTKKKLRAARRRTKKEKRKGKELLHVKGGERVTLSDSWRRNDLCGSTCPLSLSLQGQRAAVK